MDTRKKIKSEVDYRPGRGDKRCGTCRFYITKHECSRVIGSIDPGGLCDLFEAKQGNHMNRMTGR